MKPRLVTSVVEALSEPDPFAEPVDPDPSTVKSEIGAALLGMGVAIACALPPLLNVMTGPVGPFAGGYIAAKRSNPGVRGRAIIAFTVGTGLTAVLTAAAVAFVELTGPAELPYWFPSRGHLVILLIGSWLFGFVTARLGAAAAFSVSRGRFGHFVETYE